MGETEGATHINMKKAYVSPLMSEVNVEAEQMLAASIKLSDKEFDTVKDGQLGGGRRGQWGNLW